MGAEAREVAAAVLANGCECAHDDEPCACGGEILAMADGADAAAVAEFA